MFINWTLADSETTSDEKISNYKSKGHNNDSAEPDKTIDTSDKDNDLEIICVKVKSDAKENYQTIRSGSKLPKVS